MGKLRVLWISVLEFWLSQTYSVSYFKVSYHKHNLWYIISQTSYHKHFLFSDSPDPTQAAPAKSYYPVYWCSPLVWPEEAPQVPWEAHPVLGGDDGAGQGDYSSYNDFLILSYQALPDNKLDERLNRVSINQCCTLVYTSGSSGPPRGVMLSHDNLTWTAKMAQGLIRAPGFNRSYTLLTILHT